MRLDRIAAGTFEPRFPREHYFLATLNARGVAHYADFIIPSMLFVAEYSAAEIEPGRGEPRAPALTAS